MNILIAYGTRHGATRGIAEQLATALREDGHTATVQPAAQVHEVASYDAVLLGGALYANRWHRDARRFARRQAHALADRPVWIFSSGPLDDSADKREIPPVQSAARAGRRLHARGHHTFGGMIAPDASGRIARSMARRGLTGDHRNPEQIAAWAHRISGELSVIGRSAEEDMRRQDRQ